MKIDLPYLDRTFPLEFPDENLMALAEPNEFISAGDSGFLLQEALSHAIGSDGKPGPGLREFLQGGSRILVILNDATRPTPTEAMLKVLLRDIEEAGLKDDMLTFIIATGGHRAPTEAEYKQILGCFCERLRKRCVYHDSRKSEDMVDLGKTRNGTPILLNKILFEADRIIATGSVEPHYHAGFTGGRKAFLPGTAAYITIQTNHTRALSPKARALALEGNPVHEDMMDALALIKAPVFALMSVLDKKQGVAAATAGDIGTSFYAAVEIARKIFCVSVPAKADIVVSVAKFPMDIDLYQSQKAIDNGAVALKDGGTLILVSACREGVGDETYAKLLMQSSSPQDAIKRIEAGYKLGYHKAAKMAEVSARATVRAVTQIPPEQLAGMFIKSAASPQEALNEALDEARSRGIKTPKIIILPDGCITIPDAGE
ncbi:MAG: nickel-dependent lactate racemase [Spirochaetales bacterium]|jgi:nickel-dependent lactate racemase|nr:nickel-dependent lactate racemase [Spirochaetales bacterium]